MKFIELKKSIVSAPPKPCYFVTGDDPFVVKSAVKMLTAFCGSFSELNYSQFEKGATGSDILSALLAPPMLADYRVVRVNDFSGETAFLKDYLKNPNPTTILVLVGALNSSMNAIISQVEVVDCNRLDASYLVGYVQKRASAYGVSLDNAAASMLVDYCSRDMNRITNELAKLVDYSTGTITDSDVENLVTPDLDFKIFELSEAIALKKSDRAITLLNVLLADNGAMSVLGLLFNHFRRLLFVALNPQSETLAADLKVKDYAVTVAKRQASRFSVRGLKAIFDKLCALDAAIKGGTVVDKTGITTFVCQTLIAG